jgi:hypothetical protein
LVCCKSEKWDVYLRIFMYKVQITIFLIWFNVPLLPCRVSNLIWVRQLPYSRKKLKLRHWQTGYKLCISPGGFFYFGFNDILPQIYIAREIALMVISWVLNYHCSRNQKLIFIIIFYLFYWILWMNIFKINYDIGFLFLEKYLFITLLLAKVMIYCYTS